ncbi:hypothetical protein RB596_004365 [Gaeumannomyces avenae]
MGLGTKTKNALHGDDRRSPKGSGEYEDGRLPGSFPSDTDPSTKTTKHAQDPSLTGRTSTDGLNASSTLRKSQHRHKKSDSGVDFDGAEPAFDSRRQPGVGLADDAEIEQPQPVKPANLGNNAKRDPYWGTINNNTRGASNANGVSNTVGAGVDGHDKDLPLRPGSQGSGPRDVYAKDFLGTANGNNGSMLNNGNTLSNVNGAERDPYWSNGNAAGLDGSAYGVNGYGSDDAYNYNSPPGTAISGGYHNNNNNNNGAALRNGHQATRGLGNDPHDVNASGLHDRGISGSGTTSLDDARIRDRDMGRSPAGAGGYGTGTAGTTAGVSGIAASEAARKHHEADMRDAGYHSGPSNGGSPTNAARLNGNSVGGARAAYGRSAGGSPPRMQQQGPVAGNSAWQQQQGQQPPSAMHFGPGAHNAARVLHTCTSCGVDNDISQYFRPDVAYRLGQ